MEREIYGTERYMGQRYIRDREIDVERDIWDGEIYETERYMG